MFAQWYVSAFNAGSARNLLYDASLPGATASISSEVMHHR
jgi:endoglucanase